MVSLFALSTSLLIQAPKTAFIALAYLCFVLAAHSAILCSFAFFSQYCDGEDFFGKGNDESNPALAANLAYCAVVIWIGTGVVFLYMDRFKRIVTEVPVVSDQPHAEVSKSEVAKEERQAVEESTEEPMECERR